MTLFKPCIDLHQGKVKQIVGGTFSSGNSTQVNFESDKPSSWFAELFARDELTGGHVIQLGSGNYEASLLALKHYPGGLQIGGGINLGNAQSYLSAGASHIIVTSWLFPELNLNLDRLKAISDLVGRERLVVDLSCKKQVDGWYVAKDKWQTLTHEKITPEFLELTANYCAEFLIHAADVEGKRAGIDKELVSFLARHVNIPTTYAGGAYHLQDLQTVKDLSQGKLDLTIGSALDIFGGTEVKYSDCVAFNKAQFK